MVNFKDRIPEKPNRRLIIHDDGTEEYVEIEYADEPNNGYEGTALDRVAFMRMQGFDNVETTFGSNTITERFTDDNGILVTTFNADGSITQTYTNKSANDEPTIVKTITFSDNGSMSEIEGLV